MIGRRTSSVSRTHEPRRRARDLIRLALASGLIVGFGAVGTMAVFSQAESVTAQIETGSIDLRLDGQRAPVTQRLAFQELASAALDVGTDVYAPLEVSNQGTLPITYDMDIAPIAETGASPPGQTLQQYVLVTVAQGAPTCDAAGWASGTVIAAETTLPSVTLADRPLDAGGSETLCFHARLDQSVGQFAVTTGPSGIAMTVNLDFTATQTP